MDVGCSLWGFGTSTMTLQHCLGLAIYEFSKNPPPSAQHNSVRVDPDAHPQHIKEHLSVYGGFEGQSTDKTIRKSTKYAFKLVKCTSQGGAY
jgi:hypothetical protein